MPRSREQSSAKTQRRPRPQIVAELQTIRARLGALAESRQVTSGADARLGELAAALGTIVARLEDRASQDRPWESGDCHGYLWVTKSGPGLVCRGACPDDPDGKKCKQRTVRDDPNGKTTRFCSCTETEPTGCHLVWIHHHETGVWEPKCVGTCATEGQTCKLQKHHDDFLDWWYYWCECKK